VPAISVGSVEVDVVPNAQGIDARLRAALVPPASQIGDEVGRIIGRQIAALLHGSQHTQMAEVGDQDRSQPKGRAVKHVLDTEDQLVGAAK